MNKLSPPKQMTEEQLQSQIATNAPREIIKSDRLQRSFLNAKSKGYAGDLSSFSESLQKEGYMVEGYDEWKKDQMKQKVQQQQIQKKKDYFKNIRMKEEERLRTKIPAGEASIGELATSFRNDLSGSAKEVTAPIRGAVAQVPEIAGNVASAMSDSPFYDAGGVEQPSVGIKEKASEMKGEVQDALGVDKDSFATKSGEFVAEVGSTMAIPGNIAIKAGKWSGFLNSVLKGGIEAGKFAVVDKGDVEAKDVAVGMATAGVLQQVGVGAKKAGEFIYKGFMPVSQKEAGLIQLAEAYDKVAPRTPGDTALAYGMRGRKSVLGKEAIQVQDRLRNNGIQPSLEKADEIGMKISKNEIFQSAIKRVDEVVDPDQKGLYVKALKSLQKSYENTPDDLTYTFAQKLKQSIDLSTPKGVFRDDKGAVSALLRNDIADDIRRLIRKNITTEFGDSIGTAYDDYSNLFTLKTMGEIARKTGPGGGELEKTLTQGSSLGIISKFVSNIITPIGTLFGVTTERVGKAIASLPLRDQFMVSKIIQSSVNEKTKQTILGEFLRKGVSVIEEGIQTSTPTAVQGLLSKGRQNSDSEKPDDNSGESGHDGD